MREAGIPLAASTAEVMMSNNKSSILGGINPTSGMPADEETESMSGGSKHDKSWHSGTRDVTVATSANRPE